MTTPIRSPYRMIPIPEAQQIVLDRTWSLPPETVPLMQALGRTLASPVVARDSLPPFPASIKVWGTVESVFCERVML